MESGSVACSTTLSQQSEKGLTAKSSKEMLESTATSGHSISSVPLEALQKTDICLSHVQTKVQKEISKLESKVDALQNLKSSGILTSENIKQLNVA